MVRWIVRKLLGCNRGDTEQALQYDVEYYPITVDLCLKQQASPLKEFPSLTKTAESGMVPLQKDA
jgi:hypothetical protein